MTTLNFDHWFTSNTERIKAEWAELLCFASISADSAYDRDCNACADWLATHLKRLGFTVRHVPTNSHPLILAERKGNPALPSTLIYGHYDVQPPDPVDGWTTPPFTPTWRNDRLYARGAQDNKGQLFYALKAIEAAIALKANLPTLKIVFEGDEESSLVSVADYLNKPENLAMIRSDILVNTDCLMIGDYPTITVGLRGLAGFTLTLTGAARDLHSGSHGGRAPNPAMALARMIATLHRDDGSIAVDGFYDGVSLPDEQESALARQHDLTPDIYRRKVGIDPVGGEIRFAPVERTSFRPTIEINGIHSGYGGSGSKTVIPSTAIAKITMRLVTGQDPDHCVAVVENHLQNHRPRGIAMDISQRVVSTAAFKTDYRSPLIQRAATVLKTISDKPVAFHWEGGSVPIMSSLPRLAGAQPVMVGFGLEEDRIHSPNESFAWSQFRLGFLFISRFLSQQQ